MKAIKFFKQGKLAAVGVQYEDGLIAVRFVVPANKQVRVAQKVDASVARNIPRHVQVRELVEYETRDNTGAVHLRQGIRESRRRKMVTEVQQRQRTAHKLVTVQEYALVPKVTTYPNVASAARRGFQVQGGYV